MSWTMERDIFRIVRSTLAVKRAFVEVEINFLLQLNDIFRKKIIIV